MNRFESLGLAPLPPERTLQPPGPGRGRVLPGTITPAHRHLHIGTCKRKSRRVQERHPADRAPAKRPLQAPLLGAKRRTAASACLQHALSAHIAAQSPQPPVRRLAAQSGAGRPAAERTRSPRHAEPFAPEARGAIRCGIAEPGAFCLLLEQPHRQTGQGWGTGASCPSSASLAVL